MNVVLEKMKTLGERIRELRGERDMSLREFARRLDGLSAAYVSDVELGRRFPSGKVLVAMASVLGIPVAELERFDSRPPLGDLKRLAASDPTYAVLLRRMVEEPSPNAAEILKFIDRHERRKK